MEVVFFLIGIIPWQATAIAHVDAVHEHGEGFGVKGDFVGVCIYGFGPTETAFFEAFG